MKNSELALLYARNISDSNGKLQEIWQIGYKKPSYERITVNDFPLLQIFCYLQSDNNPFYELIIDLILSLSCSISSLFCCST